MKTRPDPNKAKVIQPEDFSKEIEKGIRGVRVYGKKVERVCEKCSSFMVEVKKLRNVKSNNTNPQGHRVRIFHCSSCEFRETVHQGNK